MVVIRTAVEVCRPAMNAHVELICTQASMDFLRSRMQSGSLRRLEVFRAEG